ncbi:MAG: prolyl oligopeptidase family serine peptidase [Planctomycetota bacterium]
MNPLLTLEVLATAVLLFAATAALSANSTNGQSDPPPASDDPTGSETTLVRVEIVSSVDGTAQPAMWVPPQKTDGPAPLLVQLHTWSGDYRQAQPRDRFFAEAQERGWAFIHPNFRGPNQTPEALASPLAIADVVDAVRFAQSNADIDATRIYLAGSSGGGHMALRMAAAEPQLWAGVSAWVPISDLFAWHATHTKIVEGKPTPGRYARMIEAACGGPPGTPQTDLQYVARSPLFHLQHAVGLPIDLNVGIHDGHQGSVPTDQTLLAFNRLADANGHPEQAFTPEQIALIRDQRTIPPTDQTTTVDDIETPRRFPVLLRRHAGPVRVTVFDGGHTEDVAPAVDWLSQQQREKSNGIQP